MMLRWYHVFLIAVVFSLAVQGWIWSVDTLTDESVWVERLQYFRDDLKAGKFHQNKYSAHPGLAPLWVALPIQAFGTSPAVSLEMSVAVLVSLIVGGIAAVTYATAPSSLRWVAAGGLAALHPLYVQSSLANAVAGPAAGLGILSLLFLEKNSKPWIAWLMGFSFGISLITHFSVSLLVVAPVLLFVTFKHGWKQGGAAILMTLLTFAIPNPLFLQSPLEHFHFNFHYISLHTISLGVARLGWEDIFLISPFAVLGLLGGAIAIFSNTFIHVFQRSTLFFLLALTVAVSAVLLYAQTQSVRYFFPLILFWEIMFAMVCLKLGERSRAPRIVTLGIICLLIAGQALLLTQALY